MKGLSEAFASALFFRILLPGLVLTIGTHPFVSYLLKAQSLSAVYPVDGTTLFLVQVALFGLIAYASTSWVYDIAIGLKARWLTLPAKLWNRKLFDRAHNRLIAFYIRDLQDMSEVDQEKVAKLNEYLSDFPLIPDKDNIPRYTFRKPTRIGNIIDTYELYPTTRYKISAIDFWYHFLYSLPPEVRKELDSIEALAEGMILSAAAAWIVFLLSLFTWIGRTLYELQFVGAIGPSPIPDSLIIYLIVYAIIAVMAFNALARIIHRNFGRHFRAVFDIYSAQLATWFRTHSIPISKTIVNRSDRLHKYLKYLIYIPKGPLDK